MSVRVLFVVCLFVGGCGKGFAPSKNLSDGEVEKTSLDGPKLYALHCASCHNPLDSSTRTNRTVAQITTAIENEPQMQVSSLRVLSSEQIKAIADALFVPDKTGPQLTIASPAENAVARTGVVLTGNCEDGPPIRVEGSGVQAPSPGVCESGHYSHLVVFTAGDGKKDVTISQIDLAGNKTSVSRSFVRDSTAPALTITGPPANTAAETGLTLTGTCEPRLEVRIDGAGVSPAAKASCASTGTFSIAFLFSAGDGVKAVAAHQTDSLANTSAVTRNFVRESPNLDGVSLYAMHCALCHNPLATTSRANRTAAQITSAIGSVANMKKPTLQALSSAQISAIAAALRIEIQPIVMDIKVSPLAAERNAKARQLRAIFVRSTGAMDVAIGEIITEYVSTSVAALGGPCSRYEDDKVAANGSECPGGEEQMAVNGEASRSPASEALRRGYLPKLARRFSLLTEEELPFEMRWRAQVLP